MERRDYSVPDIMCDACAGAIRRALGGQEGISRVDVDVPSKAVSLEFDPARITEAAVRERLARAGFTVAAAG
jgi:P-type Cu+ transporter